MISIVKRLLYSLLLTSSALLLLACITTAEMQNRWSFVCPDGYTFNATYPRDKETVRLKGQDLSAKLRLRESDSPAVKRRYASDSVEFLPQGVLADLYIRIDTDNGYSANAKDSVAHLQCQGNAY